MPIYEYQCEACGHRLETLQKISDDPLTECPACGQSSLQKLVSAAGFRLKGSGWYATDFKDKGIKKSSTASESGKSDEGKSSEKSVKSTATDKVTTSGTKSQDKSAG